MTITINQISSGMGIRINSDIYTVSEYSHVKPGKGSAFVRVKLKNLKTDLVLERTFKSSDKLEDVFLEERTIQYLYQSSNILHFLDQTSFEEIAIPEDLIGQNIKYLRDNLNVTAYFYNGQVQKIDLPNFIEAEVVETEPGLKGDSARAGTKFARIDSGAEVQVPLFIETNDKIKIDTRSGVYIERVKK